MLSATLSIDGGRYLTPYMWVRQLRAQALRAPATEPTGGVERGACVIQDVGSVSLTLRLSETLASNSESCAVGAVSLIRAVSEPGAALRTSAGQFSGCRMRSGWYIERLLPPCRRR